MPRQFSICFVKIIYEWSISAMLNYQRQLSGSYYTSLFPCIQEQIELLELGMARVVAEFRAQAEEATSLSHQIFP